MKEYIIFYDHSEYGYYTTIIEGDNITDALFFFIVNYSYNDLYGIMVKK